MKIEVSKASIKLVKELNDMDKLVIDFAKILDRNGAKYVLVSGYVSILFGRSRSSEDVDVIVGKMSRRRFSAIWKDLLRNNFQCIPRVLTTRI